MSNKEKKMDDSPSNIRPILHLGQEMLTRSHSPYSGFRVASVAISDGGNLYGGCNVENSSYASTVCAEVCAITRMVANGSKKLQKIFIFSDSEKFVTPCGSCRQVILEFSQSDISVVLVNSKNKLREHKLSSLIPYAFSLETEEA